MTAYDLQTFDITRLIKYDVTYWPDTQSHFYTTGNFLTLTSNLIYLIVPKRVFCLGLVRRIRVYLLRWLSGHTSPSPKTRFLFSQKGLTTMNGKSNPPKLGGQEP